MYTELDIEDTLALLRPESRQTALTDSTNSTASGIRGPGRTVDAFLSAAGRGLERLVIRAAEQWSGGPNALVARMLLLRAGRPSCPCQRSGAEPGKARSDAALDPVSVLRLFIQFSAYRCESCSRPYPDILMNHKPFLQDCKSLVNWTRSSDLSYQCLAVQHILAMVALDRRIGYLFLTLGVLDTLKAPRRQSSAVGRPARSPMSDAFDTCDYAVDVLSSGKEVTLTMLLQRYENVPIIDPHGKRYSITFTGSRNDPPLLVIDDADLPCTSLYQQCSTLCSRLKCIRGFANFFTLASVHSSSPPSIDPVTRIRDLFSLGAPLCFLYNLLRSNSKIIISTSPDSFDYGSPRERKRAIALFAMHIKEMDECEPFAVTELWDRSSTDGLTKVVNNVIVILKQLPESLFEPTSALLPAADIEPPEKEQAHELSNESSEGNEETAWDRGVKEIIESERRYVQTLETMQRYSDALFRSNTMAGDAIHQLLPNIKNMVNFQRHFLIRLESVAELPRKDQRWGIIFTAHEEEFSVYEPYCANFPAGTKLISMYQDVAPQSKFFGAQWELSILRIKPIYRICNYPFLLKMLIQATSESEYPHYEELLAGLEVAKRVATKNNEALRRAENAAVVKRFSDRVKDWNGYHLSNFGQLVLHKRLLVTTYETDRELDVFLFEKTIVWCKEIESGASLDERRKKHRRTISGSTVQSATSSLGDTPLALKNRIWMEHVIKTTPQPLDGPSPHSFEVQWRSWSGVGSFTLHFSNEEQMRRWQRQIDSRIKQRGPTEDSHLMHGIVDQ